MPADAVRRILSVMRSTSTHPRRREPTLAGLMGLMALLQAPGAASASRTLATSTVLELDYGSGPLAIGRSDPDAGNPECAMSFAVTAKGTVYVLDQLNLRVVVVEHGRPSRSVDVMAPTYQELTVEGDGSVLLLDRLVTARIDRYASDGRLTHRLPLLGGPILDGGDVTGMFRRGDGLWIEVAHDRLVRVADAHLTVDPLRPVALGRFSHDGKRLLSARKVGPQVELWSQVVGAEPVQAQRLTTVSFDAELAHIAALELLPDGRVAVAALVLTPRGPQPIEGYDGRVELVLLAGNGVEQGRAALPEGGAAEQFRTIRLGDDGNLYQLSCGERRATLTRVTP